MTDIIALKYCNLMPVPPSMLMSESKDVDFKFEPYIDVQWKDIDDGD